MDNLKELRNSIDELIKGSSDKETIDKLSNLSKLTTGVEDDMKKLCDKNTELLEDYKKAVLSSSFKGEPNTQEDITGESTKKPLTFEEALFSVLNKK